ncbi:MAG TPA: flagellar hook-length control protein FliK [Gammaproteobacteria bacterium]|nr:flagellar hook-length control protein FliK [Gammaproteobacteria bacterium]
MPELTLLVNPTDATLLNGSVASPVANSGGAAGGFAGVLGKRLLQNESVVANESPPQMADVRDVSVTETGEAQPVDGKVLPVAVQPTQESSEPEAGNPVLNASLLSAIAQGVPAVNGAAINTPPTDARATIPAAPLAGYAGMPQSTLSHRPLTQRTTENSTPPTLSNVALSPQAPAMGQQNISSLLPNVAQDAQQVAALPAMSVMPGKPVSATAQQALVRASLNTGKAQYLPTGAPSVTGPGVMNAQQYDGLSATHGGSNNPLGNTMRMDIFAAAMGAAIQAGAHERRLPVTPTGSTTPVSLVATNVQADDASSLSAGMLRLPGVAGNGVLPTLTVATPMGQPAWASELGQRVSWLANSELREAQLQLNPRSLGAVDVRIVYGPEQQLNVSFSAANPAVRDALDASLPRLREMFEQQGLQLADANISHEAPAEREQRNNMNKGALTSLDERIVDEVLMDAAGLDSLSPGWLGEGMLDAYA